MSELRAKFKISKAALLDNFAAIVNQVPGQAILPMVKADGYGHGAAWVASVLADEPLVAGFGVATVSEGIELRLSLNNLEIEKPVEVYVFSGATPWTPETSKACRKYGLTPVISSIQSLKELGEDKANKSVRYHLKFNTGMNRLGIGASDLNQVFEIIEGHKFLKHNLEACFSHLAASESPESEISKKQLQTWKQLVGEIESFKPECYFHLANSAGIFNSEAFDLLNSSHIVRPGLALYGVAPWQGFPEGILRPIGELSAPVIELKDVSEGDIVGYGTMSELTADSIAEFNARSVGTSGDNSKGKQRIAVVGAGYADGLLHQSGKRANVFVQSSTHPESGYKSTLIGNVSMDLCMVRVNSSTKIGDNVVFVGKDVDPWEQAKILGTIPYQFLTSVSPRVMREYND